MSVDNFIPELTAAEVQTEFAADLVFINSFTAKPAGSDTIRSGNAVKIINAARPTVQDYKAQGRTVTPEDLEGTDVTVLIDQEKATSVWVDDVDAAQAAGDLSQWTDEMAPALAEDSEAYALLSAARDAVQGSTDALSTDAKFDTACLEAVSLANAAKVPVSGRKIFVLPGAVPRALSFLAKSPSGQAATGEELREGKLGRIYGFELLSSAAVPAELATTAGIIAYHEKSAAYVGQIDKTQAVRPHNSFKDAVSALLVYGFKVIRPTTVFAIGFTKPVDGEPSA
ncbi:hypothetical protein AB2L57_10690 [Microbacterium sp. HA-8]|uniref:hypothetical protein n=1 Tax=Microbacterium sp. HA-8 TaxID=3234200 RepID=UPI0038F7DE3C